MIGGRLFILQEGEVVPKGMIGGRSLQSLSKLFYMNGFAFSFRDSCP